VQTNFGFIVCQVFDNVYIDTILNVSNVQTCM